MWRRRLAGAAVVLTGFALRAALIETLPPGLYHDEGYNGLDALGVLDGQQALYLAANNGREPLFIYLAALLVSVLGPTPVALRLTAAYVGTLLVAAVLALGQTLLGRRAGWMAAGLVAVAPWPVILGRVGFRAGTLPLVLALAAAATAVAIRRGDRRWSALGGALAGLTLYTYTAARVLPLLVALMALVALARGWRPRRAAWAWLLAAVLVALPMVAVLALDPAGTLGRMGQVSVLGVGTGPTEPMTALRGNVAGVAEMLALRGDFIARHNIPLRPVFGPAAGALAVVGLVVALARSRGSARHALIVLWMLVMALPTLLAENAPHFLRAVGMLPALALLPALGADWLSSLGSAARTRQLAWVLLAALAIGGELRSTWRYGTTAMAGLTPPPDEATAAVPAAAGRAERWPQADHSTARDLYYAFEGGATTLAREVNQALGRGWRGGWAVGAPGHGHAVWLDRRLRDGWAAVPFLVPVDTLTLNDPYDPVFTRLPGTAFLQPSGLELDRVWGQMAPEVRLEVRPGALERGDLETEPRPLYVRIEAQPRRVDGRPLARFANGLVLAAARLEGPVGETLAVRTEWETQRAVSETLTAFVQVLGADGTVLATTDKPLGDGLYPTPRWRIGDRVVARHRLTVPGGFDTERQTVVTGLYVWPAADRRVPLSAGVGDTVVLSRPDG